MMAFMIRRLYRRVSVSIMSIPSQIYSVDPVLKKLEEGEDSILD